MTRRGEKGEDRAELPGSVGQWKLGEVIGEGGMGIVARGTGAGGRLAAIKLLHYMPIRRPSDVARFEREARIRIDSPHVVSAIEAGVEDALPWIAFELLSGQTLQERLEDGPLGARQVVDIGIQAARGLEAAHAASVIHRDLKPSNLFLCDDGTVKIIDFGIARLDDDSTRLTRTGHVLGTPTYLSPEQATGARDLDHRTDIWALGCVLYEALVGRAPFDRATALATMLAVMVEQPLPLASAAPRVPPEIARVIERCIQKKPAERWADARALRLALEGLGPVADVRRAALSPTVSVPALPSATPSIAPGEQRVVAVLLADDVSDERVLRDAVEAAGGAWLPVAGARALGLFGAEAWEGDELERAAGAALEARGAARWISLASGRAAYSGATGIAGSALSAAEAGLAARVAGVAIDAQSARALSDRFSSRRIETEDGTALFEITDRVSFVGASLAPPASTTTVGREAEIAQLAGAIRATFEEERPVAVVVTGPPGAGKSHLRWVLERLLADHGGFRVLSARPEPGERRDAFSLFRGLLLARIAFGVTQLGWPTVHRSQTPDARLEGLRRLVGEAFADPAEGEARLPFIAELIGIPVVDEIGEPRTTSSRLDPMLMRDRIRLAIEDWLVALAERGPIAVLLEDLQWADDASLELLEELIVHPAGVPVLLFATARPEVVERRPALLTPGQVVHIQPRGLTSSEVARLAASILGRELPPASVRALADRTAGNPLFVEQIVLAMREGDEDAPLPLDVETAVQSRLDHLPAGEKDLCKRASVFGRPFTADELVAAGVADPRPLLSSLMRRDILAGQRSAGGREYRFRSTLVRDVAYRMIAPGLVEEMHDRVATQLLGRPDADPEETAIHLERADRYAEAAAEYVKAAQNAARRGDAPSVLRCIERALALTPATTSMYALHASRAEALELLGRLSEQDEALDAALAAAGDDAQRARVLTDRAVWLSRHGRREEAIRTAEAAVEAARRANDDEALALARGRQTAVLTYAGRLAEAEAAWHEASSLAQTRVPGLAALAAVWRAQLVAARGDHGARCDAYRRAVALYQEAGDLRRAAGAEMNLADAYNRFGAYADAERALRAALEACRRLGIRLMEGYALANLGYALTMLGRPGDALSVLDEASALATSTGETRLGVSTRLYRARALLRAERAPEAETEARTAEEEARALGDGALEALALSVRGAAALAHGSRDEALRHTTRAMQLRDALGSIEEDEAELFAIHARALSAAGRDDDAREVRARGAARLEDVAARITDPAMRHRFIHDVPTHRELVSGWGGGTWGR